MSTRLPEEYIGRLERVPPQLAALLRARYVRPLAGIGHVTAVQHLVQRQCQEGPAERGEFMFSSLGRRFGRPVEVLLSRRIQNLNVLVPQIQILRVNLGKVWIRI